MKLSFSLSNKPSSKQPSNTLKPSQTFSSENLPSSSSPTKEFLTEFDPSKTLTNPQSQKLTIPPKPNEWVPHEKMKNLRLPIESNASNNLEFEVEPNSNPESTTMSFGLNLRHSATTNADPFTESTHQPVQKPEPIDGLMLNNLKRDLKRLPEDLGFEEFDGMPIEDFGKALLSGYGWYEGRGIGKKHKEDVKVKEYDRRTAKEGLGYVADMITTKSNTNNSSTNSIVKNKKDKAEESNDNNEYYVGKEVRIVDGREMGLKGKIVEVMGGGKTIILKLSRSEEEVRVRARDVADLGSVQEEKCLKKLKELKIRETSKGTSSDQSRKESNRNRGGGERREKSKSSAKVCWLSSNIRVRIISEDFKGGRLYRKKGKVVGVVGPTTCDVSMDESREVIQGVDQELLETVLPRSGGPVLVLYGRRKGAYGSLVEKNMDNETGVVKDADTHELINVRLEQIAEYTGDPIELGY